MIVLDSPANPLDVDGTLTAADDFAVRTGSALFLPLQIASGHRDHSALVLLDEAARFLWLQRAFANIFLTANSFRNGLANISIIGPAFLLPHIIVDGLATLNGHSNHRSLNLQLLGRFQRVKFAQEMIFESGSSGDDQSQGSNDKSNTNHLVEIVDDV